METFRFNFSDGFKERLVIFSNKHKDDNLETFKDNYEIWCEENKSIIDDERVTLERYGFVGNIEDKMFKSIRYYFMKRIGSNKSKPKKRQKYICKDIEFLNCVKEHIDSVVKQKLKPSVAYENFSEKYIPELDRMKDKLINVYSYEEKDALKKIKKIYKNKYFTESKK